MPEPRAGVVRAQVVGDRGQDTITETEAGQDWGTGGFTIEATRMREARRGGLPQQQNFRSDKNDTIEARAWQDLSADWSGWAGASAARSKSGGADNTLMTHRTKSYSGSVEMGLAHESGARVALSAFDAGGWRVDEIEDMAIRLANGEDRARAGVAAEIGWQEDSGADAARPALTLRIEQADSRDIGAETSARVVTRLRF